jgi:hypothetical protein
MDKRDGDREIVAHFVRMAAFRCLAQRQDNDLLDHSQISRPLFFYRHNTTPNFKGLPSSYEIGMVSSPRLSFAVLRVWDFISSLQTAENPLSDHICVASVHFTLMMNEKFMRTPESFPQFTASRVCARMRYPQLFLIFRIGAHLPRFRADVSWLMVHLVRHAAKFAVVAPIA